MPTNDEDRRRLALAHAVHTHGTVTYTTAQESGRAESVLKAAAAYEAYLKTGTQPGAEDAS